MQNAMPSNWSFDAETDQQGAAGCAGERTPYGVLPVRAGQLQRKAASWMPH